MNTVELIFTYVVNPVMTGVKWAIIIFSLFYAVVYTLRKCLPNLMKEIDE